ncbi:MAG: GTP pyrophosphokinase family protein [Clostridia bacterium]|nr:GTP pyrophosphokinase family protein [Clostridia bacterium]
MINIKDIDIKKEEDITSNFLIPINVRTKEFGFIMAVYKEALCQVYNELAEVKENLNKMYGYDVIQNITGRIKSPSSIINKMNQKNYELNYKSLIENINDIAGLRITCPLKSDVYMVIKAIKKDCNMRIIKSKDYIKKPKSSGYSGYHIIVETLVNINGNLKPIKVEIQVRTMAMDFWATNEHKMKYKTNKKLSRLDSVKLTIYAKIINFIDDKIMQINKKQQECL